MAKKKYATPEEYLEKMVYPSLKIAINDLITEIKEGDYYNEIENEFNRNFFRTKGEIIKQKKLHLKLEKCPNYVEGGYDYWNKNNEVLNESKGNKDEREEKEGEGEEGEEEEEDPCLDDSELMKLEEESNKEDSKSQFNPINFLVERLREINSNYGNAQNNNTLSQFSLSEQISSIEKDEKEITENNNPSINEEKENSNAELN